MIDFKTFLFLVFMAKGFYCPSTSNLCLQDFSNISLPHTPHVIVILSPREVSYLFPYAVPSSTTHDRHMAGLSRCSQQTFPTTAFRVRTMCKFSGRPHTCISTHVTFQVTTNTVQGACHSYCCLQDKKSCSVVQNLIHSDLLM